MSERRFTAADAAAAAEAAAHHITGVLDETLASRDLATLAISGGTTPKLLFARLAQLKVDWERVHVFWVDERSVLPQTRRVIISSLSNR